MHTEKLLEKPAAQVSENRVWGCRIFHGERGHLWGVVGLPDDFVALHGFMCAIVGDPAPDVVQAAYGEAGWRMNLARWERGQGKAAIKGLLFDLTA